MLLDLWPWIFPSKVGGDDFPGGWIGKSYKKKVLKKAVQNAVKAGRTEGIPASVVLEAKGLITAPRVDWEQLQKDLTLTSKLVRMWQEEQDIEAILVMI